MGKNTQTNSQDDEVFKRCTMCGQVWKTLDDFLADPRLEIVGYQVHFEDLTCGLFLFNHSCKTTLAIHAGEFKNLYEGPIFQGSAYGSDECPGYCLHKDEMRPCLAQCECAYVREILQIVKGWKKKDVGTSGSSE